MKNIISGLMFYDIQQSMKNQVGNKSGLGTQVRKNRLRCRRGLRAKLAPCNRNWRSLFFLQYQDFWKKVSQRDISWYPRALQYRVPGFLCHAVTLKKKERLRSNKSVTVTFFLQYRDSLPNGHGQNTGFEKNPGYRDFKKSWYWKKIWDIFWTIFGVHFWSFSALIDQKGQKRPFFINFGILMYAIPDFSDP